MLFKKNVCFMQHRPESWVKLKPVSPVLLPGASKCPPPASMAVRCGDIPKSENKNFLRLYKKHDYI